VDDLARLLEGLDESQRHAVTVEAAPLCVLAGAGSGKTRVLSRRIAWRVANESATGRHVLALTFTRKAAGELRERLAGLGVRDQVAAGTFHAVAYAQLRRWWADRGRAAPVLLDRKGALLHRLLGSASGSPDRRGAARRAGGSDLNSRDGASDPAASSVGPIAAEIEWAKARLVEPDAYADAAIGADRRPPVAPSEVAEVYARYEAEKRRRGLVDFDDLLEALAVAMETDEELAAAQRWRFRHLFVDEFQDVNPAQWRLLSAWLGTRTDLCVVGDPNQAIYGWNGADPGMLATFALRRPDATVVQLDANYRSSPQVLSVAAAVLSHDPRRAGAHAPLRAHCPDGPVPDVVSYDSDRAEAAGIARRLRQARPPGTSWSRLAVLARTNAQLVLVEEALSAARIPCRVAPGAAFLRRPEVQAALGRLRQSPRWHTLETAIRDLELSGAAAEQEGHRQTEETLTGQAEPHAVDDGTIDGRQVDATERALALGTLARLAREYQALEQGASVEGFVVWLASTLAREQPGVASGDAVELTTFHRAKGLEWPVVFVAGLEEGLVPIAHAVSTDAEAEERRLLYVALTRAQLELHCSWARRRTLGHRSMARSPSPYLEAIEAASRALVTGERLADVTSLIEEERRRLLTMATGTASTRARRPGGRVRGDLRQANDLRAAHDRAAGPASRRPADRMARSAEPKLLEALRTWRARSARAAGVPPHVVLHDTTLAAVAASRPSSIEELIGLPGLGPLKANRYGAELLDLTAQHRARA
jgi:DNA helicase-2/ATP-dependent DNA helicase PcrA